MNICIYTRINPPADFADDAEICVLRKSAKSAGKAYSKQGLMNHGTNAVNHKIQFSNHLKI